MSKESTLNQHVNPMRSIRIQSKFFHTLYRFTQPDNDEVKILVKNGQNITSILGKMLRCAMFIPFLTTILESLIHDSICNFNIF